MIILDTNVLLVAFRAELRGHDIVRGWLQQQMSERIELRVPAAAQIAFVRLATRRLGPFQPAPLSLAASFLAAVSPLEATAPKDAPMRALALCETHRLAGDGTVDAWIAAYALCVNAPLATLDQGFAKYAPALNVINPLQ